MLSYTCVTKNAPIKLPITYDPIKKVQNMLMNSPLFESFAHSDIYLPCATQRILAPNPQIAAPTKVSPYARLCRFCRPVSSGFSYISRGKIVAPTYVV